MQRSPARLDRVSALALVVVGLAWLATVGFDVSRRDGLAGAEHLSGAAGFLTLAVAYSIRTGLVGRRPVTGVNDGGERDHSASTDYDRFARWNRMLTIAGVAALACAFVLSILHGGPPE
jgi:hypothetical protein